MSVGLDVHARSVVACGLDGQTGELFERWLTPDRSEVAAWIEGLPGPVAASGRDRRGHRAEWGTGSGPGSGAGP
jgi:hypothetical protein